MGLLKALSDRFLSTFSLEDSRAGQLGRRGWGNDHLTQPVMCFQHSNQHVRWACSPVGFSAEEGSASRHKQGEVKLKMMEAMV